MYLRWLTAWIAMVCKRLLFVAHLTCPDSRALARSTPRPRIFFSVLFHGAELHDRMRTRMQCVEQLGAQNLFHLVGFICLRLASEASVSEGKLNSHRHRKHAECACGVNHLRLPRIKSKLVAYGPLCYGGWRQ